MDERWQHVEASMRDPDYDIDENWPPPGEFLLIRIVVHHDGMMFWNNQLFARQDWDELEPDAQKWILDEMVKMLDERMDEHEQAHASGNDRPKS